MHLLKRANSYRYPGVHVFCFSTVQAAVGNDRLDSPWNVFSPELLELVVSMSTAAKNAGYLVTAGVC